MYSGINVSPFFLIQYSKNISTAFYKFITEIVIFLLPILALIVLSFIFMHHFYYGKIFYEDYYLGFDKWSFKKIIIDKETEMEIKMASDREFYEFEDKLSNIIFTKVYLKEMERHHILTNKTFLNISKLSYENLDNDEFRFSIDENQINKYLDNDYI